MDGLRIPHAPLCALWVLERAGFAAYIVGGCLRDALRGERPHDWDVTTSARPEQMLEAFAAAGYQTVPTGLKHGTVTVLIRGEEGKAAEPVECTTYRIDGDYTDARHPDRVSFTDRIADDLARRDFTVNAMACRVRGIGEVATQAELTARGGCFEAGALELLDLYGGQEDLAAGILRCVGEPRLRFTEDALRILRGVRFCVQLGLTPEGATRAALVSTAGGLCHVSAERVAAELTRMLSVPGGVPSVGLHLMSECGLWRYVLPEVEEKNAYFADQAACFAAVDALPPDVTLRLAALLCGAGEEGARAACRRLKLSTKQTDAVSAYVGAAARPLSSGETADDAALRRRMAAEGDYCEGGLLLLACIHSTEGARYRAAWERCRFLRARGDCLSLSSLAVDGRDLMAACGVRGRDVGRLLARLLDAVLEHPEYNTRDKLLALAGENDL